MITYEEFEPYRYSSYGGTLTGGGGFIWGNPSYAPLTPFAFGSFANANYGGSSAFFSPYNNVFQNALNTVLYPALFNPQYVNLQDDIIKVQGEGSKRVINGEVQDENDYFFNLPYLGGVTENSSIFSAQLWNDISKKFAIIMFALMLLGLGFFFLAKSTDTGKQVISGATKGVL